MTDTIPPTSDVGKKPRRRARWRGGIWPTRRDLTGCYVTVNRYADDLIDVCIPANDGRGNMYCHPLPRQEARMLARRINQCLDATVIR